MSNLNPILSDSNNPFVPPKNDNIDTKFSKVRKEIDNTKDQVLINIDKEMKKD